MSDYVKTTDFSVKDSLLSGNPAKVVKGVEINTEFDNIATAVATKIEATDIADVLETTDIGVTVQGYDATTLKSAAIGVTIQGYDATTLKSAAIGTTVQAYDADTAKLDVAQAWTSQQTFKELKDTVHTITDGAAFEIDPANGSIQVVTLGASRTPAATNFEAGQVVLLGIDDGTAYSITWTTVAPTWVKVGGTASAPTLATSGYTWVMLWKVGSTIYGCEVGKP